MKDTTAEDYNPAGQPWTEARDYLPLYGDPIPAGAAPQGRVPNVASMRLYRVAPAGTTKDAIAQAIGFLSIARDAILLGGWVRGMDAAGPGWFPCEPRDRKAFAWSMTGALQRAIGDAEVRLGQPADIAQQALTWSIRERHAVAVSHFNDRLATGSADAAAEFNAAIDLLAERTEAV